MCNWSILEQLTCQRWLKAEVLNTQFQSFFTQDPDVDYPASIGPSPHPQMPYFQIGVDGITKCIKGLNIHKEAGPKLINGRLLKECCNVYTPILQHIFQRLLESGIILDVTQFSLIVVRQWQI